MKLEQIWYLCVALLFVRYSLSLIVMTFHSVKISINIISQLYSLSGHVFLGRRGTKRPGPTSSGPPKKRKCSICKQEGNAAVPFQFIISMTIFIKWLVFKLSYKLWLSLREVKEDPKYGYLL